MFRFISLRRSCPHLTGYAAFAQVAFKMPVMERVPGGFKEKNLVSHTAWKLLDKSGRREYTRVGRTILISGLKRSKTCARKRVKKARSSFLCHAIKHPGWKRFVKKNYHRKEVKAVPFNERLEKIAELHFSWLREQRRLRNLELRKKRAALKRKLALMAKKKAA